ncbi:MAG TPA: 2-dehydropantoate 2-reductase [Bacteroidales bacterium]
MKIAIIGTGGVGGYFGAKLGQSGNDVTFLARGEHLRVMQTNGLTVKSILGDFKIGQVKATDNVKNIGTADLIILGIKAWQVKDMALELLNIIDKNTVVLPLQNGILATEELTEHIDRRHVIGGLCRIISKIESPGVIQHMGVTPTIVFGEPDNSKSKRILEIQEIFNKAGFIGRVADDIEAELWKKFISICVSGLLAVTRSTYGEIRTLKETRQLMIGLMSEIFILSKKMKINLESDFIEKTVSYIDGFSPDMTSSLARDVWAGKPSEIEYQNGTVVKLGNKYGVDTPINKFIYECILPMEKRARAKA